MPTLSHSQAVNLILWDGKASTKKEIRQHFGDAAAFIDGPDGVGGIVKWCTIAVPQEADKPPMAIRIKLEQQEDGTYIEVPEEYDPFPNWQPASPRVFHTKPGEYILLGDDPGALAEESVRQRWPELDLQGVGRG